MDINRVKSLAGLNESPDFLFDKMISKLEQITGGATPHMSQLDMIYQWVKTGHADAKQFRRLIDWWSRPPARTETNVDRDDADFL